MKKLIVLFVLLSALCAAAPVFADEVRGGDVVPEEQIATPAPSSGQIDDTVNSVTNELIDTGVTTDRIVERIERKGEDIVRVLQTAGKYVCIGSFLICCVLTLVGVIGNKRLLVGGAIGLILSGVSYAGIVCGREIVNWIASWASS